MRKGFEKIYLGLCLIMLLLFAGCSDVGDISRSQESESDQNTISGKETESGQRTESGQETSTESTESLIMDTLSRNCYQAFYSLVSKSKDSEWAG